MQHGRALGHLVVDAGYSQSVFVSISSACRTSLWTSQSFGDKFVYVNIVCFDVGCFSLIMKCTCLGLA